MTTERTIGVGLVGAGSRGGNNLGRRMAELAGETGLRIAAICDVRPHRLREISGILTERFAENGAEISPALYDNHAALVADPNVDLVVVTTPQCAHRGPAVCGLESGKRTYVDKPLAHTLEDAIAMVETQKRTGNPLLLGFTRRYEPPWQKAFELVRDGAIGPLHMIIIRDLIPFHVFFHRWHRRRKWSGGALNDKSSHHCDVLNWFAQGRAAKLSAFGGRRVYLEETAAPERCGTCDRECPYRISPTRGRPISQEEMAVEEVDLNREEKEFFRVDNCVFGPGADIKDHASIQVAYDNGVVGTLLVSFFGPKAEDQETMELLGTDGSIFLTRHTGELRVIRDHGRNVETIDCRGNEFKSSHFGADLNLVRRMWRFARGEAPVVSGPEGYEATRMVMAVHRAIDAGGGTVDMDDMPEADL